MAEVIVPLHNNGHFVMLDVILPSQERNNGEVFIYDYLGKVVNERNLRANLGWAKFFRIFYKRQVLLNANVYIGIKDTSLDSYNQRKYSEIVISSLDHGVLKNAENYN